MFLSSDRETCLNNLRGFINSRKGSCFQAIKVKVRGEAFFVKDIAINRNGLSFEEYMIEAEQYWGQDQTSESQIKEILFVGEAEVVEIIDEIKK